MVDDRCGFGGCGLLGPVQDRVERALLEADTGLPQAAVHAGRTRIKDGGCRAERIDQMPHGLAGPKTFEALGQSRQSGLEMFVNLGAECCTLLH
jgi:hypothetical protein